jgi:class 3 adenylate cyclase/tetratricopeptide (TPR) repeat protein
LTPGELMRCSSCGSDNPTGKRFCGDCGAALGDALAPKAEETISIVASASGERRHLTVLFCDLVGSTEIAAQLDPEEWREVVAGYHRAAAEAITRYGGYVAQYLGDGVMAYFGWPVAHENDAERAARAGLAVLEGVAKLNQQSTYPKISVRVGIDSGVVVVGAGAGKDADVFGETPNIAARVQTAAAPDTVQITSATYRLLSGLFLIEERGAQELKGITNPVELYRVLHPSGVRGRLATVRGLTPFVGREEELRLLLSRWERVRDGAGQLVLVAGEAGIGKSRLVAEFHDRIRDASHIWMESAGEQFFQSSPFHAVTELLSQWLDLQVATNPDQRIERLEQALVSAGVKPEDSVALIADLLQLPVGERYPAIALTPEQKRRRLLAVLTGWVFGAARLQPVVMVIEDLHWLDPSTLELLQLLADQGVMVPLMLICTARPEFHPQWPMRSHYTQITLNRLSVRDVREMVALVTAHNALNNQNIDAVIERTGGNPLFVEELTHAVLESGGMSARAIPVTLHDSLMARLDRLGSAKNVLQLASVIGGEFSYELLHALHPGTESELDSELHKLTEADLLYFRGIAPEATYQFKHALIRDAAYEALLKSRRKELHRLVARTIDEKFPLLKEAHPEVVARHWTDAGETRRAIAEWSRAGKATESRNAFVEALQNYREALASTKLLPPSSERDLYEVQLGNSVVRMLQLTKGWGASEAVEAREHIAVLLEKSGGPERKGDSFRARAFTAYISGDLRAAGTLLDQALELALRDADPTTLAHCYMLQICVHYYGGDLTGAEKEFTAGLAFFEGPTFKDDPDGGFAAALGTAAWNARLLGRDELARERAAKLMAAVNHRNPHHVAFSSLHSVILHLLMREYEHVERLVPRALEFCEQYHFPNEAAVARCALGYACAQLDDEHGIALMHRGIAALVEIGSRIGVPYWITALADAQRHAGALADAFATVEHALEFNNAELAYRPESLRVRGEIQLKLGDSDQAESDFRDSIALAQRMQAKAWELRSTMSFARVLARQGRRDEARAALAEIYDWFTEGCDTADLKEAKALLVELSC